MARREPHFVSRYFIKMMLSYGLVIIIGMGLVSGLTTSWVVRTLTEKESRVDREMVRQVRDYSDDKYKTIRNIFVKLYMPLSYYDNYSVMDYLKPRKLENLNRKTKREVISGYLQDICSSNSFISDIFIVDYGDRDVFFFSNVAGRDPSLNYDFYSKSLPGGAIDNKIRFVPNHIPDYINSSSVNNYSVLSYCIYLFDENAVRFNNPLGYIVVNVWADHFKAAIQNSDSLNGTMVVVDPNGLTLFDSSGEAAGAPFNGEKYGIDDLDGAQSNDQYVVNMLTSDQTGYRFVNIVNRDVIRREAGAIRRRLYGILVVCVVLALVISLISASWFISAFTRIDSSVLNRKCGLICACSAFSSAVLDWSWYTYAVWMCLSRLVIMLLKRCSR